jgi:hypothetical protein
MYTFTPTPSLQANELFNGRLAMLGFAAAVVQQLRMGGAYGPGPVAQVGSETNCRGGRGVIRTTSRQVCCPIMMSHDVKHVYGVLLYNAVAEVPG